MLNQTTHFRSLAQGIASRRRSFLWKPGTKELIYPPRGEIWDPTTAEEAMCDAFILFVVSELEEYFEGIIGYGISAFEDMMRSHILKKCGASSEFFPQINNRKSELSKNNNANWSRIGFLFEFIGLKKEIHFPPDFWSNVESIVKHRGDLAHKGISLSIVEDRRNIIGKIETIYKGVKHFDMQFQQWHSVLRAEIDRLRITSMNFEPEYQR